MATWINEFPHRPINISWHPTGNDFSLEAIDEALGQGVQALEFDLHLRDGKIRVNHDSPSDNKPTLEQSVDRVLQWKGDHQTVQNDGYQFFLWLDLKSGGGQFYQIIYDVFGDRLASLSTAVAQNESGRDYARALTIVITGNQRAMQDWLNERHGADAVNRRFLFQNTRTNSIQNISDHQEAFEWNSYRHPAYRGRVNDDHQSDVNVRTWNTGDNKNGSMSEALRSGVDKINANLNKIDDLRSLISSQQPRGSAPGIAFASRRAAITWRGKNEPNLYVAQGQYSPKTRKLGFERQIALTYLLEEEPMAEAPAIDLRDDGTMLLAYEGTGGSRLWTVAGRFIDPVRFVTFDGGEHRLLNVLGSDPSSNFTPDGRVLISYRGTNKSRLFYVTGQLAGVAVNGQEHRLTEGDARRGSHPRVAFVEDKIIVVYKGTDNDNLFYVVGSLSDTGEIVGDEHRLTIGDARRGSNPSIAASSTGQIVIVYEGTNDQKLFYVSGRLDGTKIEGQEFSLTEGSGRRGHRPAVAFTPDDDIVVLYEGTGEERLWYVAGQIDETGRIDGDEHLLDMGIPGYD